jgi:hypothetical protein
MPFRQNRCSNTAQELALKRTLPLQHGAMEFWIDPDLETVEVWRAEGVTIYRRDDTFPVELLGGALAVKSLLA